MHVNTVGCVRAGLNHSSVSTPRVRLILFDPRKVTKNCPRFVFLFFLFCFFVFCFEIVSRTVISVYNIFGYGFFQSLNSLVC